MIFRVQKCCLSRKMFHFKGQYHEMFLSRHFKAERFRLFSNLQNYSKSSKLIIAGLALALSENVESEIDTALMPYQRRRWCRLTVDRHGDKNVLKTPRYLLTTRLLHQHCQRQDWANEIALNKSLNFKCLLSHLKRYYVKKYQSCNKKCSPNLVRIAAAPSSTPLMNVLF